MSKDMPNSRHSWFPVFTQSARHLSREKIDTLILVFSCMLVVANHITAIATWISISSFSLMIWRAWLIISGRSLPTRWLLLPVCAILMGGIFYQFKTFFGREAGVAMIILLLACKMLEMHAKRDLFVVVFLSFFLLLTSFFSSQSLISAGLVSASIVVIFLAQLSFQFTDNSPSVWLRLKMIIKMIALTIPLTITCFFLFPRIQGPLWGLPSDAGIARTGLSDSMSPGNISKLAMSEELVFRVKFLGQVPQKSESYWRAIVLDEFDGRTWTQAKSLSHKRENDILVKGTPIHQQITVEPSGANNLFGLDIVSAAPNIDDMRTELNRNAELHSPRTINNRIRYNVTSYSSYRLNPYPHEEYLRQSIHLPRQFNPSALAFAQGIQNQFTNDQERISAVLKFFHEEKFFYTLEPPLLGTNSIDDFLFSTRSGFCEHYSSAFVFLMRAMQIPARVVTGYQGGTLNTQDGFLEVRQSDAHAWAEVWLQDEGWVRIDPTAAVAPDRILKNLDATQKNTGLAGLMNNLITQNTLLSNLRMRWSAINNSWNQWVLNYNEAKQLNLLRSLGLDNVNWAKTLTSIFIIGVIVVGFLAVPLLGRSQRASPIDELYSNMCKKLSHLGLDKQLYEGPTSFLSRISGKIPAEKQRIVRTFIQLYVAQKYGRATISTTNLRQLKILLKQL